MRSAPAIPHHHTSRAQQNGWIAHSDTPTSVSSAELLPDQVRYRGRSNRGHIQSLSSAQIVTYLVLEVNPLIGDAKPTTSKVTA